MVACVAGVQTHTHACALLLKGAASQLSHSHSHSHSHTNYPTHFSHHFIKGKLISASLCLGYDSSLDLGSTLHHSAAEHSTTLYIAAQHITAEHKV